MWRKPMGGSGQGEQMAGGGPGVHPGAEALYRRNARSRGEVQQLCLPHDTAGLCGGKDPRCPLLPGASQVAQPQLQVVTAEY